MATAYEQAISGMVDGITVASGIICVRDGNDTWLCRETAWDAVMAEMETEPAADADEGGAEAYSDLCRRVAQQGGPIVSLSGQSQGSDEEQAGLVYSALARELLDDEEPLALRYFPFQVDARVEGGKPGTEDHDVGTVVELRGDGAACVAWERGACRTWLPMAAVRELRREGVPYYGAQKTDPGTGLPRWDLPGGWHVRADSAVNGGGLRVVSPMGLAYTPEEAEHADPAKGIPTIPADHPARAIAKEMTDTAIEAQRAAGRTLATIMRDGRRS